MNWKHAWYTGVCVFFFFITNCSSVIDEPDNTDAQSIFNPAVVLAAYEKNHTFDLWIGYLESKNAKLCLDI